METISKMKEKEAIKRIKQNKAATEFYASMTDNTQKFENEMLDMQAFDLAISALKKQIPMHFVAKDTGGGIYPMCPNCGYDNLYHEQEYCDCCGQRIKWGSVQQKGR